MFSVSQSTTIRAVLSRTIHGTAIIPLMRLFAQTLELKDDPALIAEYRKQHRAVWPEVAGALRSIGIRSMRIFLHGNRLFMIFEADDSFDPSRDFQSYTQTARCREWDELMRTFQQQVPGAREGEWWTPMEEVFDLSWCRDQGGV